MEALALERGMLMVGDTTRISLAAARVGTAWPLHTARTIRKH